MGEIKKKKELIKSIHSIPSEQYNPLTKEEDFKEAYCYRNHGHDVRKGEEKDKIAEVRETNRRVARNGDKLVSLCWKAHNELQFMLESEEWKELIKGGN